MTKPEYNLTDQDYSEHRPPVLSGAADRRFSFARHARLPPEGKDATEGPLDQATTMFAVAEEFGVGQICTMCPPEDIAPLRERFGDRIAFNGPIHKLKIDDPDDSVYRLLDRFLAAGVIMLKFWSAPRGRERGLFVDAPWRSKRSTGRVPPASACSWCTLPIRMFGSTRSIRILPSLARSRVNTSDWKTCCNCFRT